MAKAKSKTITIFLILISIILISGTSISVFLLQKEVDLRKAAEEKLALLNTSELKLQNGLELAKKQVFILEEKNKELDERINSLLDDLELEEGLRDEMRKEISGLKEQVETSKQAKEKIKQDLTKQLEQAKTRVNEFEQKIQTVQSEKTNLSTQIEELSKKNDELQNRISALNDPLRGEALPNSRNGNNGEINLNKIVVASEPQIRGRVLSVDRDTEFLIFDLGSRHGVASGQFMSIFRGDSYLGDVKVSRVQDEMAAADFVPPFSSRKVRKNDQVSPKI